MYLKVAILLLVAQNLIKSNRLIIQPQDSSDSPLNTKLTRRIISDEVITPSPLKSPNSNK